MLKIDINCDMGESFGAYSIGQDSAIMPYITSANIACGFHAGDPDVMKKTVSQALEHRVSIGAHPGLPDLQGFGRRNMVLSPEEVYSIVVYQIGALNAFVEIEGGRLRHVKPHGALYNMAAADEQLARAIASAVKDVSSSLVLYGLAGSKLIEAGEKAGLPTASEVFADRTYTEKGMLTPRSLPDALITCEETALSQVTRMVKENKVRSTDGVDVAIQADTVCIHGDGAHALAFARLIKETFEKEAIEVRPIEIGG